MCIAIFKPADKSIPKDTLRTCFDNNDDGAGFSYINTDFCGVRRLKIKKYMKFEDFYKAYEKATRLFPDSPFIIHFRIGTHGEKSSYNCHPFWVRKDLVFIHNGIISGVGTDKRKSDTQLFNDKILKKLPKDWERNDAIWSLIHGFIGMSKLIFLNTDGEYMIVNEDKGEWVDGVWYSNSSYKVRTTYFSHTNRYDTYRLPEPKKTSKKFWEIDEKDLETCEECNRAIQLKYLKPYKVEGAEPLLLCSLCAKAYGSDGVLNGCEEMTISDFIKDFNKKEGQKYSSGYSNGDQEYAC